MRESPQATALMSHAYSGTCLHIVFSSKERRDSIPANLEEKLWAYLFGICRNLKIPMMAVGGTCNHVHILISLPATVGLSDAIKELKANSSRWLGEHGVDFQWQKGYGAFSVSPSNLDVVQQYIRNQEEHHRKRTFDEEFSRSYRKSGISFAAEEALS
jgi:REP element-mobilizing transposase RayT